MNQLPPKFRKIYACETPGCATNCAWAFSCHNARMGNPSYFWPAIALLLFAVVAAALI